MTDLDSAPAQQSAPQQASVLKRRLLWPLRNVWRSLTSMRIALALLFLLALAAVPGALLPQRSLNDQKTKAYIDSHGWFGRLLDKLQFFEVFSSGWFTAIYVLLFISLVGCLTPRMIEHAKSVRAKPVAVPRNLTRMPRHARHEVDGTPEELADRISGNLRGWRRTVTTVDSSTVEVSAEKGYLRELGNLVFHFALLALLVSIAAGKLWGYEGTRTLVADDNQGLCNTSTAVYDSFRGGNLVDGTNLTPFCVNIDSFSAKYLPNGQPDSFSAKVHYQSGAELTTGSATDGSTATIKVNDPLRIAGDRVYLLGHGYAPTFTVRFPDGEARTQTVPFAPNETATLLSSGAARFDTPAGMYSNDDQRRKNQIAIEGIFAPTASYSGATNSLLTSSFPAPRDPAVAVRLYKGDTGLDTGRPQNVYSLDQNLINQGRLLQQVGDKGSKRGTNLSIGQSTRLPDGTVVSFDGYKEWASMQVSHDPAQMYVLISAIAMLAGLLGSLLVKRRRVWARIQIVGDGASGADGKRPTVVEMAGLARTDQAGWGEGFDDLVKRLIAPDADTPRRKGE